MKKKDEATTLSAMKKTPHVASFFGLLLPLGNATQYNSNNKVFPTLLPPKLPGKSPSRNVALAFLIPTANHGVIFSLSNWFGVGFGKRSSRSSSSSIVQDEKGDERIRIGVIGGGIAGISVASALAKKLLVNSNGKEKYEIVVLEGDPNSAAAASASGDEVSLSRNNSRSQSPKWQAASAKNANGLVPGAAMHVFSRKSVMWQVAKDTVWEWWCLKKEALEARMPWNKSDRYLALTMMHNRTESFSTPPPYFALHLWKCLGPSAEPEERASFLRYLKAYLYSTVILGDKEADTRGRIMCDLAKANRAMFLQETENLNKKGYDVDFTFGFLALYRSLAAAKRSMETTVHHGEKASLLEWEEVLRKEPRLGNLPVSPLFAVHRPDDIVSSCESFVRAWTHETRSLGVTIHGDTMVMEIEPPRSDDKSRFQVICENGTSQQFDVVVLAAGIRTPLLASRLKVGEYVPVYPLRGFSMTVNAWQQHQPKGNLLRQSFSVDSLYCSSVSPFMSRWAGFGEFAGYPRTSDHVPSLGPEVLSRYATEVFPDAVNANVSRVLTCSRPASPDDVPIVGELRPGLFVHTGHGTLGWTTGLATGECAAQVVAEYLDGRRKKDKTFKLSEGIVIDRAALSPRRFAM